MFTIRPTVDKSKKVSLLRVVFARASALLALEPLDVAQSGPVESYGGLAAPIEGTWILKIYRVTQAITFSALPLAIVIFAPTLATNVEAQDVRLPTMGSVVTRGSNPTIAPRLASLRAKAERGNREAQLLVGMNMVWASMWIIVRRHSGTAKQPIRVSPKRKGTSACFI